MMSLDSIASSMVSLTQAKTQNAVQVAIMRQERERNQMMVDMLDGAVQAAKAPGTGMVVDRRA